MLDLFCLSFCLCFFFHLRTSQLTILGSTVSYFAKEESFQFFLCTSCVFNKPQKKRFYFFLVFVLAPPFLFTKDNPCLALDTSFRFKVLGESVFLNASVYIYSSDLHMQL